MLYFTGSAGNSECMNDGLLGVLGVNELSRKIRQWPPAVLSDGKRLCTCVGTAQVSLEQLLTSAELREKSVNQTA